MVKRLNLNTGKYQPKQNAHTQPEDVMSGNVSAKMHRRSVMDKLPWELISPIAFVVLGIALIIITGFYPVGPVKDLSMILLGAIVTRIKIPNANK
jgi:hypothetical protein